MAQAPSQEDHARKLLKLFVESGCRPGDALPLQTLLSGLPNQPDRNVALAHAAYRQWIKTGQKGAIHITEAGYAEAGDADRT